MPDTYNSQDYVAPVDKLRAILGGQPMPGMVQPPPQATTPASVSAAQTTYGRPAPTLPVVKGVTNLQPSAPVNPPAGDAPAPDMMTAINTPKQVDSSNPWGSPTFEDQARANGNTSPLPYQRAIIPPPPYDTPARQAAQKTLGTAQPQFQRAPWWKILLGSLATGAMAYDRNPHALEVGDEAINSRYYRSLDDWRRNQAQAKDVLGEQDKAYGAQSSNWRAAIADQDRDERTDILRKGEADRADYQSRLAGAREENNRLRDEANDLRDPSKKLEADMAAREKMAKKLGLRGADYKYYLANGKLREPKDTSGGDGSDGRKGEYKDWYDAFVKDNGRVPNAEEIADRKYHPSGGVPTFKDKAGIERYSDKWYEDHKKSIRQEQSQWDKANPNADEKTRQKVFQKMWDDYQGEAKDFEERKKGYYDALPGSKPVFKSGNAPVSAAPSAPPAKADERVRVREKATGKTGTLPKSQLKDALATGKYEQL